MTTVQLIGPGASCSFKARKTDSH